MSHRFIKNDDGKIRTYADDEVWQKYEVAGNYKTAFTLVTLREKAIVMFGAGEGNRTPVTGLGSRSSTIELRPLFLIPNPSRGRQRLGGKRTV